MQIWDFYKSIESELVKYRGFWMNIAIMVCQKNYVIHLRNTKPSKLCLDQIVTLRTPPASSASSPMKVTFKHAVSVANKTKAVQKLKHNLQAKINQSTNSYRPCVGMYLSKTTVVLKSNKV